MKEKTKKITSILLSPVLVAGVYLGKAAPIGVTALVLTKCGDSNSSEDEQTREHYGDFDSGSISVWQEKGVSDADMDKIWGYLELIKGDTDWVNNGMTAKLETKIDEIQVVPGNVLVKSGRILKIGIENSIGDIAPYIVDVVNGAIALNQMQKILPTMENQMMVNLHNLKSVIVRS